MAVRSVLLLLFGLAAPCWCQDVRSLNQNLDDVQVFQDAFQDPYLQDQLQDSMAAINSLLTVYLPRFLENPVDEININISEACINSTLSILIDGSTKAMPEIIPLLDATGKLGAGLMTGNLYARGAVDECFEYDYTGYCVSRIHLGNSSKNTLTAGLCVPKHCTAEDMSIVINSTELINTNEIYCEDAKTRGYSKGSIVMLFVCGLFMALVVMGTVIDVLIDQLPAFLKDDSKNEYSVINSTLSLKRHRYSKSETVPLVSKSKSESKGKPKILHTLSEFITAFSLFKTLPTLLATKQAPGVITSLNGLRVLSMFWVILSHTHMWALNVGVDNGIIVPGVLARLSFQPIGNGFFSVDSFFFLSGVLVAYLSLRQMKKKNGRFPFLHYYIHRYLRLTPTYAFVLFFTWGLAKHLTDAPYLILADGMYARCPKYWWTNLLYINNLYPWSLNNNCIGWTWYLANDMQFYIISPLILIPLYYLFPIGLAIAGVILMCGFIVTATLTGVYDLPTSTLATAAYGVSPNITATFNDLVYVKPWGRISPYIVGLILGYVLYKGIRIPFNRRINSIFYLIFWITSGFLMFSTVYGLYFTWHGHIPTRVENVLYVTFSRFAWGVGLALMVFACHNGYGWFINSFLSMPMWTPLSRMSFNAYLVHPVVLSVIYDQLETSVHYTDITLATLVVGMTAISYGVAGVICVFVELPLGSLEMLLFKLVGLKGRESQRHRIEYETKEDLENEANNS